MAFPDDFWLGDSCRYHCEYPRAPAHQIVWSTVSLDAASNHRVDNCVLAFPSVLEFCAATLFQRQFVMIVCNRVGCRAQDWQAKRLPYNTDHALC
jgi:hypothetical protein